MTADEMQDWLLSRYEGLSVVPAYGERTFFVNPDSALPRGTYFATIKEADGPNDRASRLDRKGVWRLSFGLPRATFERLFGERPARPGRGGTVEGPWDFSCADDLMPHPVYGWMGWVCVVSPGRATIAQHAALLDDAFAKAQAAFAKRVRQA